MLISQDIYFKTMFEWLSQFALFTPQALRFFEHRPLDISQGSVATRLGCGGI